MKYRKYGTPSKLFERFERVNKVKFNESIYTENTLETKLTEYYNLLKQNQLDIKKININVNGGESFVEIEALDNEGNNITFNFQSTFKQENTDDVYNLYDGKLIGFSFKDQNNSNNFDVEESALKEFNETFGNEIVDVISDYVDVENNQPDQTLYNEAVKKIDKRTFKPLSINENNNIDIDMSTISFENLPYDVKSKYLKTAEDAFRRYLGARNVDLDAYPLDEFNKAINKIAEELFVEKSQEMNEDYPDQIVKDFKTNKSDPFKNKKSSKKTKVINELNTDTVAGYSNIDLPQSDFDDYEPMNVGDDDLEDRLLGYEPIRENRDNHCVIWDGTSAYIGPIDDVKDEINNGNEILKTFSDIDDAQEYADRVNAEAYSGYEK